MTDNLSSPCPSHRTHGRLAATLLIVAGSALGCDATEPTAATAATDRAPDGLPAVRSAGDNHGKGDRSVPFDAAVGRSVILVINRPTIGNLDPDLLDAIQDAARDARDDGVKMVVTSGWRSRGHQQRLFLEAIEEYGSEDEARRWVSTPDTSAHVTGDAVDIGPTEADNWLSQHGSEYGLCQIFANEIWHYELATTPGGRCPDVLPDSSSRS